MSIVELGALGEFIGSIGVVVTLLFLALQIRQNTKISRSICVQQWNLAVTPQNEATFRSKEFAEIVLKASRDYSQLEPVERRMLRAWLTQSLNNFELLFFQLHQGTIDQVYFESKIGIYLQAFELPYFRDFWDRIGPSFLDPRFRAFVNKRISDAQTAS